VLGSASRVLAARGKRVLEFALKDADAEELAKAMIGPSGNLRAPVARVGKTFLVGYNKEMWASVIG